MTESKLKRRSALLWLLPAALILLTLALLAAAITWSPRGCSTGTTVRIGNMLVAGWG